METIKLKILKEDYRRIIYTMDQDSYIINNKVFKIKNNTSNLSIYLNNANSSLIELLNKSVECECINCGGAITHNRFERKKFITYKFCNKCESTNIVNYYKPIQCVVCGKNVYKKNIIYSTCGDDKCIKTHKQNTYNNIKKTHWIHTDNADIIIKKKTDTRLKNDKEFNRKYIPWNKGKTGIYSKETIEKLQNATINQMKNGRIKKTRQEKIFEDYLIKNNIKYKYSFIYNKRQYDFLLVDYNIVVELQGDYWHANPKFWDIYNNDFSKKKLYETQIMKKKDDIIKKNIILNSKYSFIEFWEYDIHNNFDIVEKILMEKIIEKTNNK